MCESKRNRSRVKEWKQHFSRITDSIRYRICPTHPPQRNFNLRDSPMTGSRIFKEMRINLKEFSWKTTNFGLTSMIWWLRIYNVSTICRWSHCRDPNNVVVHWPNVLISLMSHVDFTIERMIKTDREWVDFQQHSKHLNIVAVHWPSVSISQHDESCRSIWHDRTNDQNRSLMSKISVTHFQRYNNWL